MENLFFAFRVVFPLFALIIIGMVLNARKIVDATYAQAANRLVFRVSLPMLVFNNIYTSESDTLQVLPVVTYLVVGLLLMYCVNAFFVRRFVPLARQGVMMQNSVHSNSILFGLPLVTNMFGVAGSSALSMIMPVTVPFFNTLGVVSHAIASPQKKPSPLSVVRSVASNPIILSALCALALNYIGLKLPEPVEQVIVDLSRTATPTALLALGVSFRWQSLRENMQLLLTASLLRLIVFPLILTTIAVLMGFRGTYLAIMFVLFAGPIAVSSLVQTQESGGDAQFAAQHIVVSTLLSGVTLFVGIFILRSSGFI